MVVFHLFILSELRRLLCNLSGNTEINWQRLSELCWLRLSHWTAGSAPFGTGGAVGVLSVYIAAGALQELKEVLLDGSLAARQPLLDLHAGTAEQTGQVLPQLLANLPVEAAVEEGVGGEAEVADPGDRLLQGGQGGRRAGRQCRVQVEGEVRQPAAEELAADGRQDRRRLPSAEWPVWCRSARAGPGPGSRAGDHGGAAAE